MERNSKSRIIRLCRIHANESWIFARIAKFQFQTCLRETSFETRHRRVTRRTTNRTSLGEFVRKNGSSVDKIIRVVGTSVFSREEVYICTKLGASASRSASTDKITARGKKARWLTAIPCFLRTRNAENYNTYVERVRKNQTKNRKLCLI